MSSELIAWVVGITLGIAVICLGLRRNLSDVTRSWLPRFGKAPEQGAAIPGLFDIGPGRRQLSPGQRRFAIWTYLLVSVFNAALAVLPTDNRLLHMVSAALFAVGAVVFVLKRPPASLDGSPEGS
jgi:hypothetical protein